MKYIRVLIIAIASCGGIIALLWIVNRQPHHAINDHHLYIAEGETLSIIAEKLKERKIIRSKIYLQILARIRGVDRSIQSGNYAIPTTLTVNGILNYLTTGQQLLVRATIPEGLTISRIGELFDEIGLFDKESFVESARDAHILHEFSIPATTAEGYLFPDTYYFSSNEDAGDVVRYMITRFFEALEAIYPTYRSIDSSELHDIVTLASMIEREYVDKNDAPLIASVFYNRLERGMRLEACSTIAYIITEIEMLPHPTRIFYQDLERNSPYNTYRVFGLPPTPISNPGSISLSAAINPAESNYLYFVLESSTDASHVFSETFDQHSEARVIFLRSRH